MLHSTCWRQSLWAESFVYRIKQEKVKAESGGKKRHSCKAIIMWSKM